MDNLFTSARFMLFWVLGSMASLYASLIVAVIIFIILAIAISAFALTGTALPFIGLGGLTLIGFGMIGLLMGLVTGGMQKFTIQQKFNVRLDGWVILSMLGGALGTLLTAAILSVPINHAIETLTFPKQEQLLMYGALPIIVPLACLSLGQFFVLQRYVRGAWLWIVAHIVAALVLFTLIGSLLTGAFVLLLFAAILAVSAAPGIVTGFTLLWLFLLNARDVY